MKYLALMIAAVALAASAQAEDEVVVRYELPNGLEVVLQPDARVPKVVLQLGYKVGSVNEPPGRSGFAHLFEHLMFSGTDAFPDPDAAYGAIGVDSNAFTSEDRTVYHAEGLASALPVMLSIEADRMANQGAAISEADLDLQRAVVLNEMRESVLDAAGAGGWEAVRAALFPPGHPYNRSVIGSMSDLAEARIEDVHAFFDAYYAPNNCILVLVGDFEVEDARALIADTFGRVPRGSEVPRTAPVLNAPTRARLQLEDQTPTATLTLGWTAPGFASTEVGALRIAAELLGDPEFGVLRKALVDTGFATAAYAWVEPNSLATRVFVNVNAAEDADPVALEATMRATVAGFIATPVATTDLERARKRLLLNDRVALEPLRQRVVQLGAAAEMLDDPEAGLRPERGLATTTLERLHEVVTSRLNPDDATFLLATPGDRGGYPAVLTESTGVAAPIVAAARDPVVIPVLAAREPPTPDPIIAVRGTLRNGMSVVHYQMPGAPLAYVAAVSSAGELSAPEGKEGIVELAAAMGTRGADGLEPEAFSKAVKDLGGEMGWKAEDYAAMLTMSAPPANLEPAVALLADAVRRPLFSRHEWSINRAEMLDEMAWRESDLADVAARIAEAHLFPRRPGEAAIDKSFKSVRSIKREEARAVFAQLFSPQAVTFYSVGPQSLEEVAATLDVNFGDWASNVSPLPVIPPRSPVFPERRVVLLANERGASQSALHVIRPAPGIDESGRVAANAVFRLLAGDFQSRLNTVIREEKGYSYGTSGELLPSPRVGSGLAVATAVGRENTADALAEIFAGFDSLTSAPVTDAELQRTVTAYLASIAGIAETAAGLFGEVTNDLGASQSLEEVQARRLATTKLTLPEVRAAAQSLKSLDDAVIAVVGDAKLVRPQLEALGLEVELVAREPRSGTRPAEPASPPLPPSGSP